MGFSQFVIFDVLSIEVNSDKLLRCSAVIKDRDGTMNFVDTETRSA